MNNYVHSTKNDLIEMIRKKAYIKTTIESGKHGDNYDLINDHNYMKGCLDGAIIFARYLLDKVILRRE